MNSEKKWFFLSQLVKTGRGKIERLLSYTGNADELWDYPEDGLLDTGAELDFEQLAEYKEFHEEGRVEALWAEMESKGIRYYSREHALFPKKLLEIEDPPLGIFVKGKIPDENRPSVAMIGARKCSVYGKEMSYFFGRELARAGVTVISGMALGVDGYAMRGSLRNASTEVTTVGVLGCGADICYPRENIDLYHALSENQCILSERPVGYYARAFDFPIRNRIISGLSDAVAVIEAAEHSGTSITVERAIEQNKEVFALPGRVGDRLSDGCNRLLKSGAQVLTSPEDILQFLGIHVGEETKKEQKAVLTAEEKVIFDYFKADPLTVDDLLELSRFPVSVLHEILVRLEIKGLIRKADMAGYIKVR